MKKLSLFLVTLFVFFLGNSLAQAQTARLQVIHNAADPAASEVDIYLNGDLLLDDFAFRTATPFIDAPADVILNIGVAAANSTSANDTLVNIPVVLSEGGTYVAIANGVLDPSGFAANPDGRPTGFGLYVKADAREASTETGEVQFFAMHGVTDAPTVDILARNVATLVSGAAYGDMTDYLGVPALEYILDITPAGIPETVVASFTADLSGLSGASAAVLASGFLSSGDNMNGEAFGLIAVFSDGTVAELPAYEPSARLQVIHNAADPAASVVDIYVNGGLLIDDFAFRTATPFISVPADVELEIGVAPGNSASAEDIIAAIPVTLSDGGTYVAIANGVLDPETFSVNPDSRSTAFTIYLKSDARETSNDENQVQFFVMHGATDAPAVDVYARGITKLVDNAAYTDITGYIGVPSGDYLLDITPAGSPESIVATFGGLLAGLEGHAVSVVASGFLSPAENQNGEPFALVAVLADGTAIVLPSAVSYTAQLSGLNENPPNLSPSSGAADILSAGPAIWLEGEFENLVGDYTMSHIHIGSTGTNGGVVFTLEAAVDGDSKGGSFDPNFNTFRLTEEQSEDLAAGMYYVNVHSSEYPAGEIRGQILISPNSAPDVSMITSPADGAEITIEGDPDSPFIPEWSAASDPDGDTVVYIWQLAADEDFNTVLVNANTGTETQFVTSFRVVDQILEAAGIEVEASITVYHRTISSDGSNISAGPSASVQLTRSVLDKTARLQVIHNAADPAASVVDIYVNGELLLDDFAFRTATPFITVPADVELGIGVAPGSSTSSDDIIATIPVTLTEGGTYVAIANGVLDPSDFSVNPDGRETGFGLLLKSDAIEASSDENAVQFVVVHGSTDAPAVDVVARGVATLVQNAAYGDISDYIGVSAAPYIIDITPAGESGTIVVSFDADLSGLEGASAVVLASGFLSPGENQNGASFGLIAVRADGTVVGLPTAVRELFGALPDTYDLIGNYPNPFNPSTTIRFALPAAVEVTLDVYNILGQRVASLMENEILQAGSYDVVWNATDQLGRPVAAGMYIYKMTAGEFNSVKRMILLK